MAMRESGHLSQEFTMPHDFDALAARIAGSTAQRISDAAAERNEADFRREMALVLRDVTDEAGVNLTPRDEFVVASGRIDSIYNRFIVEYKKPGVLKKANTHAANVAAIDQLKGYLQDIATREHRSMERLAGVALDGRYFVFVRPVAESWVADDPVPVSPASTERFLRMLFSLAQGRAL